MTTFEIKGPVGIFDNQYYVEALNGKVRCGYLYPDGKIREMCHIRWENKSGWYVSEYTARRAIERYLAKKEEKTMADSNSKLVETLKKTVDKAVNEKVMFTAFDITKKVRDENPEETIYHTVVKSYIHDRYENSGFVNAGYNRVLVDISDPAPWLYFIPGHHDPADYVAKTPKMTIAPASSFVVDDDQPIRKTIGKKDPVVMKTLTAKFAGIVRS